MRVAYCLSGHLRTFRKNTTLKPLFFDVNPPGPIICHTYATRNFRGQKWHGDDDGADDRVTSDDVRWLADKYGPLTVVVDFAEAGHTYMPGALENCGFRHTRQRVNELRQAIVGIDCVVMLRWDIGFREPFILPDKIEPNTIYAAYNGNMAAKGLDSDTITYGHPDAIDALNIPAVPPELADTIHSSEMCGEKLCTAVRKLRGLDYKTHRVKHFFYRSHGELDVME